MKIKTKTEFRQIRSFVKNNEQIALQKAMQSLDCNANELELAHTTSTFVFKLKENRETAKTENTFIVHKTADYTLQNAKQQAMDYFSTFEGNIKTVHETDSEIAFGKVRG